jgi:methylated-DNA-[protein]-cysteine S-methyltransferase
MNQITIGTPLGCMLLAAKDEQLTGVWFVDQRHFPTQAQTWPKKRTPLLSRAERDVKAYLEGDLVSFSLPLAVRGTDFQRSVWEVLQAIPYAGTTTYGQLARTLGKPSAARAVGAAVGRNPWTLVVPCHRVVGAQGSLTGYAGGIERKQHLLALEQRCSISLGRAGTSG